MKFFVSADMEGIAAAVSWKEYEADYARLRRLFTQEVKAVCDGILKSGQRVDRILVCDAHGSGQSLLIEELPEKVALSRGNGRPLMMMDGLDRTFDLVFFVGYHSGAGTERAQMDHTYSSSSFYRILINGRELDEAMINAALAGHFRVPVGFVSGDDRLIASARLKFGSIETVVTKHARSRFAAIVRHPGEVLKELAAKAAQAVAQAREFKPYRLGRGALNLEIQTIEAARADLVELIPGIRRTDGRTLRFRARDMLECYRTIRLAAILAASASAYL
jgi:D-amino peptidase